VAGMKKTNDHAEPTLKLKENKKQQHCFHATHVFETFICLLFICLFVYLFIVYLFICLFVYLFIFV